MQPHPSRNTARGGSENIQTRCAGTQGHRNACSPSPGTQRWHSSYLPAGDHFPGGSRPVGLHDIRNRDRAPVPGPWLRHPPRAPSTTATGFSCGNEGPVGPGRRGPLSARRRHVRRTSLSPPRGTKGRNEASSAEAAPRSDPKESRSRRDRSLPASGRACAGVPSGGGGGGRRRRRRRRKRKGTIGPRAPRASPPGGETEGTPLRREPDARPTMAVPGSCRLPGVAGGPRGESGIVES